MEPAYADASTQRNTTERTRPAAAGRAGKPSTSKEYHASRRDYR